MEPSFLISALLPVFFVIFIGHIIKRTFVRNDEHWRGLERISYILLTPTLIFNVISTADLDAFPIFDIALILLVTLAIIFCCLIALYPILTKQNFLFKTPVSPATYTSIFQTSTRWQGFISLAIAASFYGNLGITVTALAMTFMIPLINVVNISMLTICLPTKKFSILGLFWQLMSNPIIIGVISGIIILLSGITLWEPLQDTIDIIAKTALGALLVSVGGSLRLRDLRHPNKPLILTCIIKLLLLPAIALTLALFAQLDEFSLFAIIFITSVPTAAGGYAIARIMGGDASFYASAAAFQVLVSFITMPIWVYIVSIL